MPKADRHVPMLSDEAEARLQASIAADPDNLELTDDELASMRPAAEVLAPDLYANLTRGRGRPRAEVTKVPVKLRLDPGIVQAFRASGRGWQTRVNAILAAAAKRLGDHGAAGPTRVKTVRVAKAKASAATKAKAIPPLNAPIPSPSKGKRVAPRRPTRKPPAGKGGAGKAPSRRA